MNLKQVTLYPCSVPLAQPVVTSFGRMTARSSLLIAVEDDRKRVGWGETWCNFPSGGMAYKSHLFTDTLMPRWIQSSEATPLEIYKHLSQTMRVIACQTGDPGCFAQLIAGLDVALWDLYGQQHDQPLAHCLTDSPRESLPLYASGVDRRESLERVCEARQLGIRGYKLKVGFETTSDLKAIEILTEVLTPSEWLAVDANQGWSIETARALLPRLPPSLAWIEEPILADATLEDWQSLGRYTRIPLAAGENLLADAQWQAYFASDNHPVKILQPDACKWGGVTGVSGLFPAIRASDADYYPHFLGSAIGLAASAHLLAAYGGDGWLEYDVQPNPLRDRLCKQPLPIINGHYQLPQIPGHGAKPSHESLATWCDQAIPVAFPAARR